MLVNDVSAILGKSLSEIGIEGEKITLTIRDGSTLALTPVIEEGVVTGYKMDYLTKKDNKQIEKLNQKIKELETKVNAIKANGAEGSDGETEENENSNNNSDENSNNDTD